MSKQSCNGCFYWRRLANYRGSVNACHYMLETGELRGISVEDCAAGAEGSKRKKGKKVLVTKAAPTYKGWRLVDDSVR